MLTAFVELAVESLETNLNGEIVFSSFRVAPADEVGAILEDTSGLEKVLDICAEGSLKLASPFVDFESVILCSNPDLCTGSTEWMRDFSLGSFAEEKLACNAFGGSNFSSGALCKDDSFCVEKKENP